MGDLSDRMCEQDGVTSFFSPLVCAVNEVKTRKTKIEAKATKIPGEVFILAMQFNIRFRDSDEGECYAGDGTRIIAVYHDRIAAQAIADIWNPLIAESEGDTRHDRSIKKRFGFIVDDFTDGYNFRLVVMPHTLI